MIPLTTADVMNMGAYGAKLHNAYMSMAHHETLGIVTIHSLQNRDKIDDSPFVDNPPVAGAAGASDPAIAERVRGIRQWILPIVSDDRTHQDSGKYDDDKLDGPGSTVPDPHFRSGIAGRLMHRMNARS